MAAQKSTKSTPSKQVSRNSTPRQSEVKKHAATAKKKAVSRSRTILKKSSQPATRAKSTLAQAKKTATKNTTGLASRTKTTVAKITKKGSRRAESALKAVRPRSSGVKNP